MRYRCPVCGAVAEIDKKAKTITVEPKLMKVPEPRPGGLFGGFSVSFPSHPDCEFVKPVDRIVFENLEPAEEHIFRTEQDGRR